MRTLILLAILLSHFSGAAAQPMHIDTHGKGHGRKHVAASGLATLLNEYYVVKDALVSGKAATAAQRAEGFGAALARIEPSALTAMENAALNRVRDSLSASAASISRSDDIEAQRLEFGNFSRLMWALVKGAATNEALVYRQYCPVKKVYWLSSKQDIRNPYFGKQMLKCGYISETL